jgi:FkbM family methyltransferase
MFLWDRLKQATEPILIYGMGNGAEKLLELCSRYGVRIQAIFASDDHARGNEFQGYPIISYGDVQKKYDHALILPAFGVYQEEVLLRIEEMAQRYEVLVPDLPLFGGEIISSEYLRDHGEEIEKAKALFQDQQSHAVFDAMLETKYTGSLTALYRADTRRDDDMKLLSPGEQEHFLDLGAYNGDTIREFLNLTDGKYAEITAMEPDAHNFKKLREATSLLPHVTLLSEASWDTDCELTFSGKGGRNCGKKPDLPGKYTHLHSVPAITVDSLEKNFTYVKMDVEGAEAETLRGMRNTLRQCHPKLLISAYHKTDDFISLPLLLEQLCPGYRMYLRRNRCLPAWEIQLYCV